MKELAVDFEQQGGPSIVLAYVIPYERNRYRFDTGVRVLKYGTTSGWAVAFQETDSVDNGGGASDAIRIERVRSSSGQAGVVVILKESGAGTATRWHVIAAVGGNFLELDPTPIRNKVLKERDYVDMGYNGVAT